ncbi:MAG: hypothetical protein ACI9Y1_001951, partial [Lentisphaeria bacterium]
MVFENTLGLHRLKLAIGLTRDRKNPWYYPAVRFGDVMSQAPLKTKKH